MPLLEGSACFASEFSDVLDLSSGDCMRLDPVLETGLLLVSLLEDLEGLLQAKALQASAVLQLVSTLDWELNYAYREADAGSHSSAELLSSLTVKRAA